MTPSDRTKHLDLPLHFDRQLLRPRSRSWCQEMHLRLREVTQGLLSSLQMYHSLRYLWSLRDRQEADGGYLADYQMGSVDLTPLRNNLSSTGIYSYPHVCGYPESEGSSSDKIEFTYRRSADTEHTELLH